MEEGGRQEWRVSGVSQGEMGDQEPMGGMDHREMMEKMEIKVLQDHRAEEVALDLTVRPDTQDLMALMGKMACLEHQDRMGKRDEGAGPDREFPGLMACRGTQGKWEILEMMELLAGEEGGEIPDLLGSPGVVLETAYPGQPELRDDQAPRENRD